MLALLEFDRDRKSMSVLCKSEATGSNLLLVKVRPSATGGGAWEVLPEVPPHAQGAAECVLERCNRVMLPDGRVEPLSDAGRRAVLAEVQRMAEGALRCLAFARKGDLPAPLSTYDGTERHAAFKLLADPAK